VKIEVVMFFNLYTIEEYLQLNLYFIFHVFIIFLKFDLTQIMKY